MFPRLRGFGGPRSDVPIRGRAAGNPEHGASADASLHDMASSSADLPARTRARQAAAGAVASRTDAMAGAARRRGALTAARIRKPTLTGDSWPTANEEGPAMQTNEDQTPARPRSRPSAAPSSCAGPLADTFALFTDGLDGWWPLHTHSIAADTFEGRVQAESITFEKRPGGRLLERMSDGTEAPWGPSSSGSRRRGS